MTTDRVTLGANVAGLDHIHDQIGAPSDSPSAADRLILDVNVTEESTRFARHNSVALAGTVMLGQANSASQ